MLNFAVVPLVGTWIEIPSTLFKNAIGKVVPLVGTWIEIDLKYYLNTNEEVVPLVGTWIEILEILTTTL